MKKLNMNKLWRMAEKRVPNRVVQTVERYKRRKEKYYFLPCGIEYKGETYYYVQYEPINHTFIVREDGTVPYYDEAKKVIELAARVVAAYGALYYNAKHLLIKRTTQSYRHILSLLKKLNKNSNIGCLPSFERIWRPFGRYRNSKLKSGGKWKMR